MKKKRKRYPKRIIAKFPNTPEGMEQAKLWKKIYGGYIIVKGNQILLMKAVTGKLVKTEPDLYEWAGWKVKVWRKPSGLTIIPPRSKKYNRPFELSYLELMELKKNPERWERYAIPKYLRDELKELIAKGEV
jgi:hypothetical protein